MNPSRHQTQPIHVRRRGGHRGRPTRANEGLRPGFLFRTESSTSFQPQRQDKSLSPGLLDQRPARPRRSVAFPQRPPASCHGTMNRTMNCCCTNATRQGLLKSPVPCRTHCSRGSTVSFPGAYQQPCADESGPRTMAGGLHDRTASPFDARSGRPLYSRDKPSDHG